MDSSSSSSCVVANLPLHVVNNNDEADRDDGECSITSADEEAEMCFFGAALSEEVLPCGGDEEYDADDSNQSARTRLSDFAQNRVSTFERNMKTLSQALDELDESSSGIHHRPFITADYHDDCCFLPVKRGSSGSMCTLKTFNSMMSDDSSDDDNISAIALIERERRESHHQIQHAMMSEEDSTSTRQLLEFVTERVETFTKNVDFAQETAENMTRNIAEKMVVVPAITTTPTTSDGDDDQKSDVDSAVVEKRSSSFSEFVQDRRNTFERNMTTIIRYHNF